MYKLPKEVIELLDKFKEAGYQIYIVGGAVRNLLMGKEVRDWDFTTDAKPEEILKIFPEGFYNNKFGTVGLSVDDEVFEITTMRQEGVYQDFRHPVKVSWTDKIEEDLSRRDFTINAMAASVIPTDAGIQLIDPFNGREDIRKKLVRAVGNPDQRFQQDALRLMRAVRIATELNFEIEEKTFVSIQKNAQLIKKIAGERIRDEIFKILSSMNPHSAGSEQAYIGIVKLREVGISQIILPELEKCFGLQQEGPKHDRVYDIGEHSLLTLKNIPSSDPLVLFAALLHDVGKPNTVKTQTDGNVTFYGHEVVGGRIILKIAKRFNLSKKQTDKLFRLIRWHMFTVSEHQTDSAVRRFIKNIGVENIDHMMALRIGDRLGGGTQRETSWRMEKFKDRIKQVLTKPFSISDLKVNGQDVMKTLNIKSGPKVGGILQKLFAEVLKDSSKNNQEYLLKKIKQLA